MKYPTINDVLLRPTLGLLESSGFDNVKDHNLLDGCLNVDLMAYSLSHSGNDRSISQVITDVFICNLDQLGQTILVSRFRYGSRLIMHITNI